MSEIGSRESGELVELHGGCACGGIRYRLTASPLIVHACHCRDCQRGTGGAFVINVLIESEHVPASGAAPRTAVLPTPTGKGQEVAFCERCGTTVWSRYLMAPADILFVRAGTLDEPERIEPDVHIYTRSKVPWLQLPAGARTFEELYVTQEVWPPEKQARLLAQMERPKG